jgi:hypothetical protein
LVDSELLSADSKMDNVDYSVVLIRRRKHLFPKGYVFLLRLLRQQFSALTAPFLIPSENLGQLSSADALLDIVIHEMEACRKQVAQRFSIP